jgi:hypothetical protein
MTQGTTSAVTSGLTRANREGGGGHTIFVQGAAVFPEQGIRYSRRCPSVTSFRPSVRLFVSNSGRQSVAE